MGVAQLTLSCDRLFITNLCFIRRFWNSSIWRAHRGAGAPNAGFPFLTVKGLRRIECSKESSVPTEIIHPTKERAGSGRGTAARARRANRPPYKGWLPSGCVSDPDHTAADFTPSPSEIGGPDRRLPVGGFRGMASGPSRLNRREFGELESAACGSPPRRAYRPFRSCGRVAEGGGLLNRYRVVKPYRGFESLRLRQDYGFRDVPSDSRHFHDCLPTQPQPAIADHDVPTHEAVGDEKGDGLRHILRLADAGDRRFGSIVGKDRHLLVLRQEVPPRRVDDAGRDTVHA